MLLRIANLRIRYGGIEAVRGVDLEVGEGELVTLIGANGAGKSSTLKGVVGLTGLAGGRVEFEGEPIHHLPVHKIAARGIALVPEGRGVFNRLTVAENLDLGAYLRRDRAVVRADLDYAYGLFPRLAERRGQSAGTLSGGEQQMLAIARALMGRPRLLLLDEPSLGLAPLLVERIYTTIETIRHQGVTILLVEQNANLALRVSQRAYVMESGEIKIQGESARVRQDARVRQIYLGDIGA
ncbi:MAG: ABC transporter ATP-binding protein [Thiotrichales bacterium]